MSAAGATVLSPKYNFMAPSMGCGSCNNLHSVPMEKENHMQQGKLFFNYCFIANTFISHITDRFLFLLFFWNRNFF